MTSNQPYQPVILAFFAHIALSTLLSQCESIRPLTAAVWCSLRHNWVYAIRHRSFVTSHGILFRSAYNVKEDKLAWKMYDNVGAAGVTTDGRGHPFVTDYDNQCIHLLRISLSSHNLSDVLDKISGTTRLSSKDPVVWTEITSHCCLLVEWKMTP